MSDQEQGDLELSAARSSAAPIDIYSVGLLEDLLQFVHMPDRRYARRKLINGLKYPVRQARRRNWRAVKNWFNGYMAEPRELPPGFIRCGKGWTRGRAYRDLQRHLAAIAHQEDRRG